MAETFRYEGEVRPGETRHVRHEVGETYLGDPIEIPVTIVDGARDGPTVGLTAAVHGDELNGVKVLQEVADRYDPADVHGTLVCLHVVNVPGYIAQTRDIPIYDQDLNRAFPGKPRSNTAERMANNIYETFVSQCDLLLDFHTSTRNRTTMYHVRADTSDATVDRLARAFGANVVIAGPGDVGSLRRTATADGTPTITIEMGKAHRFQPTLIERALEGVSSVFAEFGVDPTATVTWPGWLRSVPADQGDKTWLRADTGGLVEMQWGPYPLVEEGAPICTISDHFKREERTVTAPFTGILVGVLENPVAQPGHPLCHLVRIDETTHDEIVAEIDRGEFDGYRQRGLRWRGEKAELD
ncbi:succinylglutamate desuccinylase/aspartoacylase family protein [Halomicroarcula limicola]|uniref:Succinylglutamate desuccinylase/aspartoacylase family protein n=1 Tax=Haloarcula limicola TaxID=1429915 RepID=A0A8J7Y8V0_9EURY|nr:succinylglutamate desuccinylase/aspartoacylase family protein [Halomicroarcula limicola]MBV0923913.1 succinylglutamate desuccinylase/aspartoacylase family protein [Halomicroarcula limicola]